MRRIPTFDEIFAVMSAASVGDTAARVAVPDDPQLDDLATKFAIAVNLLLDDLHFRAAELDEAHKVTQMELERLVDERTRELTSANQELESFAHSVSHDLRSPLRAIDGFSEILVKDYGTELPEEAHHYLQRVRAGAQRMGRLIDDLLIFSRYSRQPLDKKPTSMQAVVKQVLDELQNEVEGRQIEISLGELPECQGDPSMLNQVVANLLENAIKYTRPREIAHIEIGSRPQENQRVYFVRDNGVGFDMRYADKLFGVFQRLHRAEEFEGTGVGLATVQRIIHRHGGRIWAESELDQGATFYFTLAEGVPLAEKHQ
jgi:light-regulated signal transduction histidine kinase (bacteriophytochrome)